MWAATGIIVGFIGVFASIPFGDVAAIAGSAFFFISTFTGVCVQMWTSHRDKIKLREATIAQKQEARIFRQESLNQQPQQPQIIVVTPNQPSQIPQQNQQPNVVVVNPDQLPQATNPEFLPKVDKN